MQTIKIFGRKISNEEAMERTFSSKVFDSLKGEINTFVIEQPHRSGSNLTTDILDQDGMVYYEFEDGSYLFLTPDEVKSLCHKERSTRNFRSPQLTDGELFLSVIYDDEDTRDGLLQKSIVKIVSFLTGKHLDKIIEDIGEASAFSIAQKLEGKTVEKPGVYTLDSQWKISHPAAMSEGEHYFLLIHGTNSNTYNAFFDAGDNIKQKENNALITAALLKNYEKRIIALEHHTLTNSPFENVELLLKNLPQKIELSVMTHSRGGLVFDTLMMCIDAKSDKLRIEQLHNYLKDENRSEDAIVFGNIIKLLETKEIKIHQVIKVASPGAGTTLLSDNIITYLRIISEFIKTFTSTIGDQIVELSEKLIVALIKSKDKKDVLAGLEVMTPDSTFLDMINTYSLLSEPKTFLLTGQSRFNLSFQKLGHNFKFMLTRLLIKDASDMVVNTASMIQGLPLKNSVISLSNDGHVHHSSYFYQFNTANEVKRAIESHGDFIPQSIFRGQLSSQRGIEIEFGKYLHQEISGKKPVIVLIPGMMASTLAKNGNMLWIDYSDIIGRSLLEMGIDKPLKADGVIATAYKSMCSFLLRSGHDVYIIPYDWRLSYESQLNILEHHLNNVLDRAGDQPIRMLTHSKGGLFFRQFIFEKFDLYAKLAGRKDFRWIMLGTPWYGSYAAVKTLIAQSKTLRMLKKISFLVSYKQLLQIFSKYPGLLEMLPMNISNRAIIDEHRNGLTLYDYSKNENWRIIHGFDKSNNHKWVLPDVEAGRFSSIIEKVKSTIFGINNEVQGSRVTLNNDQIFYIAGNHEKTPYNLIFDENSSTLKCEDIIYRGDGTVTWAEGIPLGFKNNHVYYANTKHERLLDDEAIFRSVLQLIETGDCNIGKTPPSRSSRTLDQNRIDPLYAQRMDLSNSIQVNLRQLFGKDIYLDDQANIDDKPLRISLSHGDLMFSKGPLMVGHFNNESITKAESRVDYLLDYFLSHKYQSGSYANNIGDAIYVYKSKLHKPKGGLIVGLGDNFKLTGFGLSETVRKGVIHAILSHVEKCQNANLQPLDSLSTLLIGTAYGDLSIEVSINAIIDGVTQANRYIDRLNQNELGKYTRIENLEFIEIYQDKVLSAFYELNRLRVDQRIIFDPGVINTKSGNRNYLSIDYGIDKWHQLRIRLNGGCPMLDGNQCKCNNTCSSKCEECKDKKQDNQKSNPVLNCKNRIKYLEFDLGTGIARDENRKNFISLETTLDYVDQIKRETDPDKIWDREISKTLFEMLIPNDFKQEIRSQHNLFLNLDTEAATLPWELIQDTSVSNKPICINAGMIRRLNTPNFRQKPRYSKLNNALVIGDPIIEGSGYGQLSGAVIEANAVIESLKGKLNIIEQVNKSSGEILKSIYAHESKLMHVAAHGDFNIQDTTKSGILIGYNKVTNTPIFLTAANISQMDVIPDFVFINTCYSGKNNAGANTLSYSTYGFAANVGEEFMSAGVKAVIVAGWPVYDDLAHLFAVEFYKRFLTGKTFGDAVKLARTACYVADPNRNTWGAYQCYGDPMYVFENGRNDKNKQYLLDKEVYNELSNLSNQLDYYKGSAHEFKEKVDNINDAINSLKISDGRTMEKLAEVYYKMGDLENALTYYNGLMSLNKADFSVRAIEQMLNIKAKKEVADVIPHIANQIKVAETLRTLDAIIQNFELLNQMGEGQSSERCSMIGSTYKRKFYLEKLAKKAKTNSLDQAIQAYETAAKIKNKKDDFYAELNLISLAYIKNGSTKALIDRSKKIEKLVETKGEYYDDILNFNKDLTEYLLTNKIDSFKRIEEIYQVLIGTFAHIWKYSGSSNNLKGEIEQLEMLKAMLPEVKNKSDKNELIARENKIQVLEKIINYLKQL